MRHRDVNAHFAGDAIHLYPTANVGIAVAVPHGLVVPVIRSCRAARRSPRSPRARADLVARTRESKLQQDDLEGGTFTISNLGMFGVEQFVAVLNPPQAAILAVGAIEERAVVARRRARGAAADDDDADLRPPRGRRRHGVRVPADGQAVPRRARPRALSRARLVPRPRPRRRPRVLPRALGFEETYVDGEDALGAARARRDGDRARRGRARGGRRGRARRRRRREGGGGAAARARASNVGTVLELHGHDAPARRLRPGRQPHPARAGRSCRDPAGRAARRRASCATCSTTRTTGASAPAGRGERRCSATSMSWGRPGDAARDRARRGLHRRRRLVPALQASASRATASSTSRRPS